MWVLFAFASAFFAGVTAVLAKCGIKKTDSTVATAIRTGVVLLLSVVMVLIVGSGEAIVGLSAKTWIFLILSGLATGASWLCYFRALQLGDINKVVPVDKSSTILTLLFAFLFLHEPLTPVKALCVLLIALGTYFMIEKKKTVLPPAGPASGEAGKKAPRRGGEEGTDGSRGLSSPDAPQNPDPASPALAADRSAERPALSAGGGGFSKEPPSGLLESAVSGAERKAAGAGKKNNRSWFFFALLSALFASLTAILGKVGIDGVESNLGTAIRTGVVLVMAWGMVFVTKKKAEIRKTPGKELVFICLSGLATGASWLCYYRALQDGLASVVVPIDKLSILFTVAFSYFVFGEKLTARSAAGLFLIVAGTLGMLLP